MTTLSLASATLRAQRCPTDELTQWRPRSFRFASETSPAERASMAPMLTAGAIARNTTYGKAAQVHCYANVELQLRRRPARQPGEDVTTSPDVPRFRLGRAHAVVGKVAPLHPGIL